MKRFRLISVFIFSLLIFTNCKKETKNKLTTQQAHVAQLLADYKIDTSEISPRDRNFLNEIRVIANDVDGLYKDVDAQPNYKAKYDKLKENMTNHIALVTQKASDFYHGSATHIVLTRNSFVVMSYDALQRRVPEFYWTKLGIFAANEVRASVVLSYHVKHLLETNNIHIVLDPSTGDDMAQTLLQSTQTLIVGQLNVLTDIGSLALLNKYGAGNLKNETWLTPEAQNGYRIQEEAEFALASSNTNAYQDLQTEAAIEFGAHEQVYILQPLWDDGLMTQLALFNQFLVQTTQGNITFFGDIFVGTNKYTDAPKGEFIKIPAGADNLQIATNRVSIARNGFHHLNNMRKDFNKSVWIDYSQARIGYHYGVYYPSGIDY
jgi:hypothetical protein